MEVRSSLSLARLPLCRPTRMAPVGHCFLPARRWAHGQTYGKSRTPSHWEGWVPPRLGVWRQMSLLDCPLKVPALPKGIQHDLLVLEQHKHLGELFWENWSHLHALGAALRCSVHPQPCPCAGLYLPFSREGSIMMTGGCWRAVLSHPCSKQGSLGVPSVPRACDKE